MCFPIFISFVQQEHYQKNWKVLVFINSRYNINNIRYVDNNEIMTVWERKLKVLLETLVKESKNKTLIINLKKTAWCHRKRQPKASASK